MKSKHDSAHTLKGGKGLARILNSTGYSMQGFKAAFINEAAFRQLVLINVILIPIACWLDVTPAERAILIAAPLLSLAIELLNSAIENIVDRVSMELHPLSKHAKDMGSAAQFVGLAIISVCWFVILV